MIRARERCERAHVKNDRRIAGKISKGLALVNRMAAFYPPITEQNVTIEYRHVGLGYAGDPNGPDVAPLVTVRLTGLQFQPITTMLFGQALTMPDFAAALTLEDGSGTVSN